MSLLFLRFPLESTFGGVEVQMLSLMKGLQERKHMVEFLGSCPILCEEMTKCHIPMTSLDIGPPPVTKWNAVRFAWRKYGMQKQLTNEVVKLEATTLRRSLSRAKSRGSGQGSKLEALFMLSLSEKLLLTEWAVQRGIQVFWIEQDRIGRWLRWNPWLWKLKKLSRIATTICVSELSRKIYLDLGWLPERVVAIPNGIDTVRLEIQDVRHAYSKPTTPSWPAGRQNSKLHIGCIARLAWEKGVDLLLEAVKDLPDVSLIIIGTGRDERKIRNTIKRFNVEQRVTVQRATSNVATFYHSLDLFILPSRDPDPCPLAPIEAMVCGVPVIMTDACGGAEHLKNGTDAIIVKANSVHDLKEAITNMMDPKIRTSIAKQGQQAAQRNFSLEKMIDTYENLLRGEQGRNSTS